MKIHLTLTAVALAVFTPGCSNKDHGAVGTGQKQADERMQDDHDHTGAQSGVPSVLLDNGVRWVANKETTQGIANMSALIDTYDPAKGDPKALKADLEEEFALIFERCTMTGEAHNQLHNYLLPIHQELRERELSNAGERDELKAYLGVYGSYFE